MSFLNLTMRASLLFGREALRLFPKKEVRMLAVGRPCSTRECRALGWSDGAVCAGGAAPGRLAARAALVALSLVLAAPH